MVDTRISDKVEVLTDYVKDAIVKYMEYKEVKKRRLNKDFIKPLVIVFLGGSMLWRFSWLRVVGC